MPETSDSDFDLSLGEGVAASLARIATALEAIADSQRLYIRMQAADHGVTVQALRAAAAEDLEELPSRAAKSNPLNENTTPLGPSGIRRGAQRGEHAAPTSVPPALPVPMELLEQSPLDIMKADLAYSAAEKEFGRGKVPPNLDLYAYAEAEGVEIPAGPEVIEPAGAVPVDLWERLREQARMREGEEG